MLIVPCVAFASCAGTRPFVKSAQVVRDCTGTYLRVNGKDYHVCNKEMIKDFAEGQKIDVRFKKIKECDETPEMVCMMYHENEGWVEIVKVK